MIQELQGEQGYRIFYNENLKQFSVLENKQVQASYQRLMAKGIYDLVVGAEGVDSTVRTSLFEQVVTPQSLGCEYNGVIINCPTDLDYESRAFEWWYVKTRFGVVPLRDNKLFVFASSLSPLEVGAKRSTGQILGYMVKAFRRLKGYGSNYLIDYLERVINNPHLEKGIVGCQSNLKKINLDPIFNTNRNAVLVGESGHSIDKTLWQV